MARITVEDCLTRERNRFALVLLAAKRAKQILSRGKATTAEGKNNKAVVSALREIADGRVRFMTEAEAEAARLAGIEAERLAREEAARRAAQASPDSIFKDAAAPLAAPAVAATNGHAADASDAA